jgi:hypothetical protein
MDQHYWCQWIKPLKNAFPGMQELQTTPFNDSVEVKLE